LWSLYSSIIFIDTLKEFIGGGSFGEVLVVDKPQNKKKMVK
jgi:hypothetical protein